MSKFDFQTIHLHPAAPTKPDLGEPCNGCGVCCALETCPIARLRFLQRAGPCPALAWSPDAGRYHCDLLLNPTHHFAWLPRRAEGLARRLLSRWIAAEVGCDCNATPQVPRQSPPGS